MESSGFRIQLSVQSEQTGNRTERYNSQAGVRQRDSEGPWDDKDPGPVVSQSRGRTGGLADEESAWSLDSSNQRKSVVEYQNQQIIAEAQLLGGSQAIGGTVE